MMKNRKRGALDLSAGGESWAGWHFGSWGNARDWRLLTPNGEALQACEVQELRALQADVGYLKDQVKLMIDRQGGALATWSPQETQILRVAMQLLNRELPVHLVREGRITPSALIQLVR